VPAGWLEAEDARKVLDARKLMRVDQDGPCLGIGRLVWHGRGAGVVACLLARSKPTWNKSELRVLYMCWRRGHHGLGVHGVCV
jgi:hypothetical protein